MAISSIYETSNRVSELETHRVQDPGTVMEQEMNDFIDLQVLAAMGDPEAAMEWMEIQLQALGILPDPITHVTIDDREELPF